MEAEGSNATVLSALSRRQLLGAAALLVLPAPLRAGETTASTAAPAAGDPPRLVVHVGNDPLDLARFEAWLGRPVDGVQLNTGHKDWDDWSGSIGWMIGVWKDVDRPRYWSIPLIPEGATLEEAAAGAYDDRYERAAAELAAAHPEGPIHVRTGWEFNGNWFPWAAKGREAAFVGAFRRFADVARAASPRIVLEWTANVGDQGMDPADAYPGDAYVDVIGMDFYYDPNYYSRDPDRAWDEMLTQRYGLAWLRDFAAARGKPSAYPEWGVTLDSSGPYIARAAEWFRESGALYHGYWNSDAAFAGRLDGGRLPKAAATFQETFVSNG